MKIKSSMMILVAASLMAACSTAAPVEEAMVEESAVEEVIATEVTNTDEAMAAEEATVEDTAMDESAAAEVSFSADIWPIIEEYALDAHGGKGGVFLESYDDIMNYVTAGDSENSILYKALIGDGVDQMPPDGPLPDEMIQTVYDWIAQGAMDN